MTESPRADEDAGYPDARTRWTAVGVLLLLYALAFLDRQVISLMVGDLRADLSIGDFQVSLLQGFAFALLYALAGLPLGMAVDRWPRRYVIFGGVMVWAAAATACGLAQNYPQLLAARILVGAGEAALAPAVFSILSDLFPKQRLTFALSVYSIGALLGAEASLALGGLILHTARDGLAVPFLGHLPAWRFAFLVTGLPGLVIAFLVFLIPEPARRGAAPPGASTWRDVARFMLGRWRFFACHFLGFSCVIAMAYARLSWNPSFLVRRFHWDIAQAGVTLAGFGFVTGVAAFLFSGSLVDRLLRRGTTDAHFRFYIAGGLLLLAFGSTAFLSPSPSLFFIGMGIAAIPLSMAAIASSAIQLVTPPDLRGRVSAVYLLITGLIGMTTGPSLVGALTDFVYRDPGKLHLSLATTFLILSPIAVAAFLLGLGPMRRAVAASEPAGPAH